LRGPGAATLGLFDSKGKAWLARRVRVSGPDNVEARTHLPTTLGTRRGEVAVVAVLMHQTNERQRVMLGDQEAAAATASRFRELKISKAAAEKIEQSVKRIAELGGVPGALVETRAKPLARRRR
jgi:hypothetical protein